MGGGRKNFLSRKLKDDYGQHGKRRDDSDLINEWHQYKKSIGAAPLYVYNRSQLLSTDLKEYDSLLGLFSYDHMPYHLEADDEVPALSEMTQKAIQMLSTNKNGFFLFVEGILIYFALLRAFPKVLVP